MRALHGFGKHSFRLAAILFLSLAVPKASFAAGDEFAKKKSNFTLTVRIDPKGVNDTVKVEDIKITVFKIDKINSGLFGTSLGIEPAIVSPPADPANADVIVGNLKKVPKTKGKFTFDVQPLVAGETLFVSVEIQNTDLAGYAVIAVDPEMKDAQQHGTIEARSGRRGGVKTPISVGRH